MNLSKCSTLTLIRLNNSELEADRSQISQILASRPAAEIDAASREAAKTPYAPLAARARAARLPPRRRKK